MPNSPNTRSLIMCLELLQHLCLLEIPKEELSIAISTAYKSSIWTARNVACVSCHIVPFKLLLPLQCVSIACLIHHNAIVQTLCKKILLTRMHRNHRHGMHRRIRNVLDWNSNIPLPNQYLLIITRRHHLGTIILHKRDCIHRCQMMIILLRNLPSCRIIRHNLIIRTSHNKDVIIIWIKLDNIRYTTIGIGSHHLAGFCIPHSQIPIERR
mmetsp:Transcript_20003/g.43077  ORF Transcript_20003/g.43077 Transcript_20003/m.43077 type:complete len:211 (-) Transcript_20003:1371-2003(-)